MPNFDHGLDFQCLDDAVAYAQGCLDHGYERTGQWDLAQTCRHLSDWMKVPMDSWLQLTLLQRLTMAVVSRTIAPTILRWVLAKRKMKSGIGTIVATVHSPETDATAAVVEFAATVTRLTAHAGPWQWSPFFRTADRKRSVNLHIVHCMHHLGRLKPNSTECSAAPGTSSVGDATVR